MRAQCAQFLVHASFNSGDTRVGRKQAWARSSCVTLLCQYTCTPESSSKYIYNGRFCSPKSQCWGFCCPKDISTSSSCTSCASCKKKQAVKTQANISLNNNSTSP